LKGSNNLYLQKYFFELKILIQQVKSLNNCSQYKSIILILQVFLKINPDLMGEHCLEINVLVIGCGLIGKDTVKRLFKSRIKNVFCF